MDVLQAILPPVITGLITFLVTKYKYHRNIPLDKLQIAYDRVYYPIYRIIREGDDKAIIIKKCNTYIRKYDKYIDRSTKIAFDYLEKNPDLKDAYRNFTDNIYDLNTKLRRQIGYPESNPFMMWKYTSPSEKRTVRICLDVIVCYLAIISTEFFTQELLYNLAIFVFALFFIFLICEFIMAAIQRLLRKIFKNIF